MNYRRFGNTDILVSEIGFGAWGIGGVVKDSKAYGPTDDKVSLGALKQAFDEGVNFYDTSPLYGYGHSEKLIGKAFRGSRDKIVISSKVGYVDFSGKQDFSAAFIRHSLEASLKRLQTEYIDIYQLHDPPIDELKVNSETIEALQGLVDEGKIRVWGISLRSPSDGYAAVAKLGFKSVQLNFSLVDQRALELDLFTLCQKHDAGIIARTPLCFGFLTGHYGAADSYPEGDHRRRWDAGQITRWAEACNLFMAQLEDKEQMTNAQTALRFVLSFPQVSTTIPGMLDEGQVKENVSASLFGAFKSSTLEQFKLIYKRNKFTAVP
jgi:aryl-alcohol dehydrogenase-like predicted oxidoreductase